jgi:hypothetical protein
MLLAVRLGQSPSVDLVMVWLFSRHFSEAKYFLPPHVLKLNSMDILQTLKSAAHSNNLCLFHTCLAH